jgi:polysaccharide biosynthesis/export protein
MKKNKIGLYFINIVMLSFLLSCGQKKQITYYQDIENLNNSQNTIAYETKIQPDDLLMILISAQDPEVAAPYNLGFSSVSASAAQSTQAPQQQQLYLVDVDGKIQMPVIGEVKVGGFTRNEILLVLKKKLKDIKDPIVNIRIMNFKVTVQGEVAKPGSFNIASERITLPEALTLAGDLTIYGKRENIILVRELNGKKTFNRIDLTKSNFINSPYYYLSQNDLIYVEPNRAKSNTSTSFSQNASIYIALASLVSSAVLSLLLINKN